MADMVQLAVATAPLERPQKGAVMAKATLRFPQNDYYATLGSCIEEVRRVHGLTLKEFACEVGKHERQIAQQIAGQERPQLEAVFAVERFRGALVIALARLSADVEVTTEIRVRKTA